MMTIKKYLKILLLSLVFAGCKSNPDSTAVKKEVLNIHDKLMVDGEKVIKNRMKLDTLLMIKRKEASADTSSLIAIINKLNRADESMMDWMHFFKDDFKGKNEVEDLAYYQSQMIKIREVEDSFIKVTKESDSVLKKINKY